MSKVRVHELAKEIGMESKDLVTRLQELGYEVKTSSSSLEAAVADEVRMKLGAVETKVETKRIQSKGRTTIIRRRTSAVMAPEPEAAPAVEEQPEEIAEPEAIAEPEETPIAEVHDTHVESVTEVAEEPAAPVAAEETPTPEVAVVEPEKLATPTPAPEPEEAEEEPLPEKGEKPRHGMARIIGRSAFAIEQMGAGAPKPKRPVIKPKGKPTGEVKAPPTEKRFPVEKKAEAEGDAKGKKGKRFVKFHTEPAPRENIRKGGKRQGRAEIEMEDVAALGGRLPAGLRIGRGQRLKPRKGKGDGEGVAETKAIKKRIKVFETISVSDLAHRMGVKANELIRTLMGLGVMATLNQALDMDTATLVATDFGYEVEAGVTEEQTFLKLEDKEIGGEMVSRPPVVTVMGHVDHGKTSILDAIRKTDVAAGEAGGITQHIGAHYVRSAKGDVVFLDTPGHAAFTEMRARGAQVTDVVVLVVAADDGVMEQTKEAINHAKAAGVPIVVAINKIDKANADIMRIKRELAEYDLSPEEWGGTTIYCETSAKANIGIEELLEQILLQAEILELKADPKRRARGWVIEAQLHKGRGPVATVLVQQGTLKVGDAFVVGDFYGRVRALSNDHGEMLTEAGPAIPVEVHGLSGVPKAGDEFNVVQDEKLAKSVASQRQLKRREATLGSVTKISLDNLFEKLKEGEMKELRILLRADVQGTLEAFAKALDELSTQAIKVKILHRGTGTITDSDVLLAAASNALIIGFNVRPSAKVQEMAQQENVDLRFYDVIYHALDDIRKAMTGLLEPTFVEKVLGSAEVRDIFQHPKVGTIAGSYVTTGVLRRNAQVRLIRDGVVVYTGRIGSLRRFKDDVKEVQTGFECGVTLENYNDIKVQDVIEPFEMEEVAGVL